MKFIALIAFFMFETTSMYWLTHDIFKPDVRISKFVGLGIHGVRNSCFEKHAKI